jgi:hypothetical protein
LQYLWPVVTLFTGKSLLTLLFCVGLIHNTSLSVLFTWAYKWSINLSIGW